MKFKIKDIRYIKSDPYVTEYIQNCRIKPVADKIVKGLTNIDKVTADTLFSSKLSAGIPELRAKYSYVMLENEDGIFFVREDNIETIYEIEDLYKKYGIKKVIRAGDTTIMLNDDRKGTKTIIKRDNNDEDDVVKALMICFLKRAGFNINELYTMAEALEPIKKETIAETAIKPIVKKTSTVKTISKKTTKSTTKKSI